MKIEKSIASMDFQLVKNLYCEEDGIVQEKGVMRKRFTTDHDMQQNVVAPVFLEVAQARKEHLQRMFTHEPF